MRVSTRKSPICAASVKSLVPLTYYGRESLEQMDFVQDFARGDRQAPLRPMYIWASALLLWVSLALSDHPEFSSVICSDCLTIYLLFFLTNFMSPFPSIFSDFFGRQGMDSYYSQVTKDGICILFCSNRRYCRQLKSSIYTQISGMDLPTCLLIDRNRKFLAGCLLRWIEMLHGVHFSDNETLDQLEAMTSAKYPCRWNIKPALSTIFSLCGQVLSHPNSIMWQIV